MSTVDIDKEYGKPPQAIKACIYHMRPEKAKIQELLAIQKSTLKAELLAKMPKKQYTSVGLVTDPHDLSKGPTGKIPIQNGYNQAITEITKLVEGM